jgi:hypothetical protein
LDTAWLRCENQFRCRGFLFPWPLLEENHNMKHLLVCAGLLFAATTVFAQQKAPASPPAKATGTIGGHEITITYSSPGVKGREGKIFTKDGLISHNPHYPIWRAGANAATTLHTDGTLMIGDLSVPKGDYTLFVDIGNPDQWTLILNKKTGEWGLAYDASQDLGKTKMHMSKPSSMVENLQWSVKDNGGGKGTITLAWENHEASVPVTVHK